METLAWVLAGLGYALLVGVYIALAVALVTTFRDWRNRPW